MSLTRDRLANEEKFLDEIKNNFHSGRMKKEEVEVNESSERAFQDDIKPIVTETINDVPKTKIHRKKNRK